MLQNQEDSSDNQVPLAILSLSRVYNTGGKEQGAVCVLHTCLYSNTLQAKGRESLDGSHPALHSKTLLKNEN